jgi:hypothetical protein
MVMSLLSHTFDDLPLFRNSDPSTSRKAAEQVAPRRGTQMARLLACYAEASLGLTDDQAGQRAGLLNGYWKRCADLRRLGYIVDTQTTRPSNQGCQAMVCVISASGIEALK